jgi:ribosomal protein S18 acetylase RimI-like enzyme
MNPRVRDAVVSINAMAPASIRDAEPDDYGAFARFFAELHAPEPAPSAGVYEEHVAPRAFFGVESGLPSALLCWRAEGTVFHVSILAVLHERRRRGLGRQLMLEAARRGRAHGFTRWQLHVGIDNAAAQALYEQLGMTAASENVLLELDAALAVRLSAIRSDSSHGMLSGASVRRRLRSAMTGYLCGS